MRISGGNSIHEGQVEVRRVTQGDTESENRQQRGRRL